MSEYNIDMEAAKQADTGGGRINETGKYVGTFTKAKKVISKKGTQGIEFSFTSSGGQSADYLSVWTLNDKGEQIYGFKQLMAIMTCLRVKGIDTSNVTVEEYDKDSSSMRPVKIDAYVGLQDKPIGVLLQMEEYAKKDGSIGEKPAFAGFFDSKSEQVATEVIEKSEPRILEKLVGQLTPLKKLKRTSGSAPSSAGTSSMPDLPGDWDDF